jgi:hypothetical protein
VNRQAFQPSRPRDPGTLERAVSDLFSQAGGIKRVTVDLGGIKQSTAYAMTEPDSPQPITLAQVATLTRPGASAVAEWLSLLAGGVFIPMTPEVGEVPRLCADDMRAHGEAIACLVEALSDGKLTNKERLGAIEKLTKALRTQLALLGALSTELRKPVG